MMKKGIHKIIILLFIMLISMALVVALGAEYFQIQDIEVYGNETISDEEIVKLSGVEEQDNIFKLDKALVKKRLESNPYIQVESIGRKYPNKLYINIDERRGGATISYLASTLVIDTEGVVLEIENRDQVPDYPIVTGLHVKSFAKGEQIVPGDNYQFRALLRVLHGVYTQGVDSIVREIHMEDPNDIYILSHGNIRIKLGQATNVDSKLKWLKTDEFHGLEPDALSEWVFDISVPGKAIFSPILDWSDDDE